MRQERIEKFNTPSRGQQELALDPKPTRTRAEIVQSILKKGGLDLDEEETKIAREDEAEDQRQADVEHPHRRRPGHTI